jgi:hypothetical protein
MAFDIQINIASSEILKVSSGKSQNTALSYVYLWPHLPQGAICGENIRSMLPLKVWESAGEIEHHMVLGLFPKFESTAAQGKRCRPGRSPLVTSSYEPLTWPSGGLTEWALQFRFPL